jgi:L-serine dehydratase
MQSISVFEMIKIGIGPSSSHTMGPWKAAQMFTKDLAAEYQLESITKIQVQLFGSLAKTGKGHGTDVALLMGLTGEDYTKIDSSLIPLKVQKIKESKVLNLGGTQRIEFDFEKDILFKMSEKLPLHSNGMIFSAVINNKTSIEQAFYSLGGGFVATDSDNSILTHSIVTPYPCHHAVEIATNCSKLNLSVSDLILINEQAWRSEDEIRKESLLIWGEIKNCIFRGVNKEGILPGGLQVKRRAKELNDKLLGEQHLSNIDDWITVLKKEKGDFTRINKWITCFALAVNEENASFGRVVTAPTNGASGVIPAVLMYAYCFVPGFDEEKVIRFILTAGEIGTLFKKNATISAAMGGCQAEIGVSSSMAAAALTECLGGKPEQVLMAAEIAIEHHLGLTCDPVGGLVQIPCIERNSMGAIKAITASNIALESDPNAARVSLDAAIASMWNTAKGMNKKFKETAEGGLALAIPVNVTEC